MLRRARSLIFIILAWVWFGQFPTVFAQEARPLKSAADLHVLAALDERIQLDFDNTPLGDFVDFLRQKHKINIQLDSKALSDAGVGTDVPISIHQKDVSLRSALSLSLRALDMTYLVQDGYLLITSETEADNRLITKVYPVYDLLTNTGDLQAPTEAGHTREADFQELVDIVVATVGPTSWDEVGGPGAIQAVPGCRAVVVSQTPDVHDDVARLFAVLRHVRDKQVAAARPIVQAHPHKALQPTWIVKVYHLVADNRAIRGTGTAGGKGMFAIDDAVGPQNPAAPAAGAPGQTAVLTPRTAESTNSANSAAAQSATIAIDNRQLDDWAKEIAALLPRIIAPETWQGQGKGAAHAAAASIVVRQMEGVHQQIAHVLNEIVPEHLGRLPETNELTARLAVRGPQKDWPSEAEMIAANRDSELEKSLEQNVDLDLIETPLGDFLEAVKETYHVPMVIDERALSNAGVGIETPITRNLRGLTLRAALKLVLRDLDLTYVFRYEVLVITSVVESEQMQTIKVYPVFDLVVRSPDVPSVGPAVDYEPLIRALASAIAPTSWDAVGGPGAVTRFTNAGALIVSQTTEVHEEIVEYLHALREVGVEQK